MVDEQRVHDAVIDAFTAFLRGDEALIEEIESAGNGCRIEQGRWRFRLPDLYELLGRRDRRIRELGYKRFRTLLYRMPVNRRLAAHSAGVVVCESRANVDRSTYSFGRRTTGSAVKNPAVTAGLEGK